MKATLLTALTLLVALLPVSSSAYTPPENSAAMRFKELRTEAGFEAALAELKQMADAPEGTWFLDERELRYAASELQWEGKFTEGIEMLEYLTGLYPESPVLWFVLGDAYIVEADRISAERRLLKALEIAPDFPNPRELLDNMDQFIAIAETQLAWRGRFQPGEATGVTGAYFGDTLPGETPEVFAEGIISSSANEFSLTFHPKGNEIYVSRSGVGVLISKLTGDGWTEPELVQFFEKPRFNDEPHLSPDGKSIFFNSRESIFEGREVFRAERIGEGWAEPVKLFEGMYATSTLDGALFCTVTTGRPDYGVIGRYSPAGDGYSEPVIVDGGVNSEKLDAHPWVAPDESFVIFDSDRDGKLKMYVCFNVENSSWGEARELNERLDIPYMCGQASMSPDMKYLFFCRHGDIWWVDAEQALSELKQ